MTLPGREPHLLSGCCPCMAGVELRRGYNASVPAWQEAPLVGEGAVHLAGGRQWMRKWPEAVQFPREPLKASEPGGAPKG